MARRKAIEILKQRECCRECVVDNGNCNECEKAFEMAIKALEQTRWVPVRERLPEPGLTVGNVTKYYLVQGEYGDMFVACYDGDKWQQIFNYDREIEEKVVAWMELPERYEPKEG